MITISKTYSYKWYIAFAPHYKFTTEGILINSMTGRIIKKCYNNGIGYNINGKFYSLKRLKSELVKIELIECPF